uniref:Glucose/Sorbosone dehydrogenase domain-containing protein n=1 Tax=Leersia perrieri TaxID=77586 RepID=A0A0D9XZZ6_9ORYZ
MRINPEGGRCAGLIKSIICEKCNPFSTALFNAGTATRTVPLLCSSPHSEDSSHTKEDYLYASTPNNQSACFNGHGAPPNTRKLSTSLGGMCLEKINDASYRSMVAHPDGSSKAFFSSQDGKIWLGAIPEKGMLQLDETDPFLDLMTEGYLGSEFRFATYADPTEVRQVFSMGLPYASNHAGQLFFQPSDGYLYVPTGNSGNKGVNPSLSQNKKSLLGKILRLNVDDLPELNEAASKSSCGKYTIPEDNPRSVDSELQPEIWALGLTNPGRCNFDSVKPYHLYCTDDVQGEYKGVDLISKGGNYGWGDVYEEHHGAPPPWAAQGIKSSDGIIFPVMGYKAYSSTGNTTTASIVGGHVYRGYTDPCLYGRYLFADMNTSALWTGMETTDSTGKYTSNAIHFKCSRESPIPCNELTNNPFGSIFSFGEDNKKDAFILTSQGVY